MSKTNPRLATLDKGRHYECCTEVHAHDLEVSFWQAVKDLDLTNPDGPTLDLCLCEALILALNGKLPPDAQKALAIRLLNHEMLQTESRQLIDGLQEILPLLTAPPISKLVH